MLVLLSVKDLLLIDSLELDLRPNLCALTGETGAGKSKVKNLLGRVESSSIQPIPNGLKGLGGDCVSASPLSAKSMK